MPLQGELFRKSQYGVFTCLKCRSVGTIVEMGRCCRVQELLKRDSAAASRSGGGLSTNDLTNERTNERKEVA